MPDLTDAAGVSGNVLDFPPDGRPSRATRRTCTGTTCPIRRTGLGVSPTDRDRVHRRASSPVAAESHGDVAAATLEASRNVVRMFDREAFLLQEGQPTRTAIDAFEHAIDQRLVTYEPGHCAVWPRDKWESRYAVAEGELGFAVGQ